jgi:hypothetical protein
MFDPLRCRPLSGTASGFVVPTEMGGSRPDIWGEAGRAVELAYRESAPIGLTVRVAVALALTVIVKLIALVTLG